MRSYRLTLLSFLLVILLAGAALWFYSPVYIVYRVQQDHPGVTIRKATLAFDKVILHDVTVERPGIKAQFPRIDVEFNERMFIHGGTVDVTLSEKPDVKQAGAGRLFKAENLEVTVKDPARQIEAKLKGVTRGYNGEITASEGDIKSPEVDAYVTNLSHLKSGTYSAESITLDPKVKLPLEGPIQMKTVMVTRNDASWEVAAQSVNNGVGGHQAWGVKASVWSRHDLKLDAEKIEVNHPWVSDRKVTFTNQLHVEVRDKVISARSGNARMSWDGSELSGEGECDDWLQAFPIGLGEPLAGIIFKGKLSFVANIKKPSLSVTGSCSASCDTPSLKVFRKPFTYQVYSSLNNRVPRVSGPGSSEWATLPAAGPLPDALITLEDPGFASHHGWSVSAFENSLKANLETGKFLRGGSTLTMQLAKNLWLTRHKSLGRKAQEVMLASALESCFSKEEIIELYLNVVEFGPDLYGITAASQKYFGTSPYSLTPKQAFWLVSILPAPRKAGMPDEAAMKRTEGLMKLLGENGRIPVDFSGEDPDDSAMKGWNIGEAPP